jgi:hemolysin activation/secretion protein
VHSSLKGAAIFCAAWSVLASAQVLEAPPTPRFEIRTFVLDGNTLIPQRQADALLAPFRGPNRDFGTVQQALEALQDAYLARGYSAVRVLVPEQELASGEVHLQVIEAKVRNIRVEGNRFFSEKNVLAGVTTTLREGESPNTRRISENVRLVNENPAKQVSVLLEATGQPGLSDAVLRVADEKPTRISLSLDNTGTPQTGSLRAGIGYQNANVFDKDQVLTVQFLTAPTRVNDVQIYGAGYRIPIYESRGALDFIAGYSNVNSGTVQGLFTVSGSGTILGARYTQMLPSVPGYDQRVSVGLDYRAFKQNVALVGTAGTILPDITVHPVSVTYTGRLSEVGSDLSVAASVSENIPGGSDGTQDAFNLQPRVGPARYRIYRLSGAWSKALPKDYLFRAVASTQFTRDPLISGEQFGMGGQDSVRGFYEREAANDVGARLSAELYGPDFGGKIGTSWRARMLAFVDAASGYDRGPAPSTNNGLSSIGLGLRINQGRSLSIRIDAAEVINGSGTRPDNKGRVHFVLAYSF